jgi:ADP-ribose pyrophosphatase
VSLDAPTISGEELRDRLETRPVTRSEVVHHGLVWDVRRDTVDLGEAGTVTREYVDHPGAVAIVALRERHGRDELLLIQQYRHPVGIFDWEIPAGLLDVPGEEPWRAAARELHEEADLRAGRWDVLVDYFCSPGGLSEALRIFVARDLHPVPHVDRHERDGEELGMPTRWVDLDQAHDAVLRGQLHNPSAVIGILSAHASRSRDWTNLRPQDAPWPEHPAFR